MKIISHRGNLTGPLPEEENRPDKISHVLSLGLDVEIDVRLKDGKVYLGHDSPDYPIDIDFLLDNSSKLWIHCKDLESLSLLSEFDPLNVFWHQEDDHVLTRSGHIWTYPGKKLCKKSIAVMPDSSLREILRSNVFGICTDDVTLATNLVL